MTNQTPELHAPGFSQRAWSRFLQRQGATPREIAGALHLDELEVRRLLARPKAPPAGSVPSSIAQLEMRR